ncbi:glycosyltransferase [Methanobrevibacter sp.]|uniref:glycosyltransferase n=1 Tax=Methanobrevibacter sp. TaxID=66852 RepID=UPI00388F15B6
MSEPKISVIMPIYNTEMYIEETIMSLINQTMFDDLDIIVIDDGSSDESRYIIEKYALDYDNIHAYHKENEGQGIARNFGLKIARGKYIHFMDSDDYLSPTAYEKLYNLAENNNVDMVIGKVLRFGRYNIWQDYIFKRAFNGFDKDFEGFNLSERIQILSDTVIWNKLYRRDFLLENDILFPDKKIYFEDILFSLKAYLLSDSISYLNDVVYYWRFRNDHTSTTQQEVNVKNLKDRLEILKLSHELFVELDADDEIIRYEFSKWLDHDLKFYIKRIDRFPKQYQRELFDDIRDIVTLIPDELIENSNSYKKVIFKMIQDNDFDNFMRFAPLENELFENPTIPDFIDEKYEGYFNYKEDIKAEDLIVEISDVIYDDDNIYLDLKSHLNYMTEDAEYDISAYVCDGERIIDKSLISDNGIVLPLDLIGNCSHSRIMITYDFGDFEKSAFIKNRHRRSIEFNDCFIDLDIGVDSYLYIDVRRKANQKIEINDVSFESGEFIIRGHADDIREVYLENVVSFERNSYPLRYENASNEFSCTVPYGDILNNAIKKWELNCLDSLNSIRVSKEFDFYEGRYRVRFINSRNKVLIEHDIFNPIDQIDQLKNDIDRLKSQIASLNHEEDKLKEDKERLIVENSELYRKLEEFKSRKAVKIADKLRFN